MNEYNEQGERHGLTNKVKDMVYGRSIGGKIIGQMVI